MKKKQIYGIIIAGLVFVFVCTASMFVKSFFGGIYGNFIGNSNKGGKVHTSKYVPVLKINGSITDEEGVSLVKSDGVNSKTLIEKIEEYKEDDMNKGILLYINSRGGEVTASDKVYLKLMEYKEETDRPIYAYFDNFACSGAYYIAMAADKIYANRCTTTGSIGVIYDATSYAGLYKKLGIEPDFITSGKNKAMSQRTKRLTKEQREIYQVSINESYDRFIEVIIKGRKKLKKDQIKKLADGRPYTAKQALKYKLIDGIKTYDETKDSMNDEVGSAIAIEEEKDENGILDVIKDSYIQNKENSDSTLEKEQMKKWIEYLENNKSGGLYYEMQR